MSVLSLVSSTKHNMTLYCTQHAISSSWYVLCLSLLQETVRDIFTRLNPDNSNEVRLVDLLVDPVALEYLDSLHSYRLPVSGHCTHCSHMSLPQYTMSTAH